MSKTTATTATVPAALRDWDVSWPQYTPTDVTPPALLPAALATRRSTLSWTAARSWSNGCSSSAPRGCCASSRT
ncbi:hypothetical protein OH791_38385 (plasmid) [Streptomyces anulatus]|uniref:hypothetical protein n=1 Tax=Streptomyces anulatus TaxID=1892 RepID=UPI00386EDF9C|nr:hypothetical protein OH791_38385 [Streptomyces anulatus]